MCVVFVAGARAAYRSLVIRAISSKFRRVARVNRPGNFSPLAPPGKLHRISYRLQHYPRDAVLFRYSLCLL